MRQIQKGSVDRSVDLYIIDATDGTPEVGVLYNTAGIDLKYRRDLSAAVSITEATLAALTTAHTDGGFLEIGNGVYRLDVPDAAWATGADHVTIFGTVTGMIVLPVTVQLVAYDPESALATPTNITAATGVVLAGVTHTGAVIPTVTTLTGHTAQTGDSFARIGATGSGLTSLASQASVNTIDDFLDTEVAAILAAVDTEIGDIKTKTDFLPSATAGAAGGVFIAGSNAATSITTALTANIIGNVTGNVSGSVGSVTGAVASVTGNVGGNVVGSVASVTARVTANTDQLAGQTVTAAAGVTFPSSVASPTNITAGTITTVTNLTNAPTAGDFTATMKASIGTAVAASAVASVTGNVGGNVTGSVGSVASGGITATSIAADAIGASELAADAVTEIAAGVSHRSAFMRVPASDEAAT